MRAISDPSLEELRNSIVIFHAETINVVRGEMSPPSQLGKSTSRSDDRESVPGYAIASLHVNSAIDNVGFYRQRLYDSTRNRLYVRDEAKELLTKNTQRLSSANQLRAPLAVWFYTALCQPRYQPDLRTRLASTRSIEFCHECHTDSPMRSPTRDDLPIPLTLPTRFGLMHLT